MSSPEIYHIPVEKPDFPEINEGYLPDNAKVYFVFGPHSEQEHFDATAELFDDSDIFIPEAAGWTPEVAEVLKRVSKARGSSLEKILNKSRSVDGYDTAIVNALGGSYKPVVLIDARKEDLPSQRDKYSNRAIPTDFETHLRSFYDGNVEIRKGTLIRDRCMLQNLGPVVTQKIQEHPKLRDKAEIFVLATLGTAHYRVFEHLLNQSATRDKISASQWSISGQDKIMLKVHESGLAIAESTPLSRQELISFFIASILHQLHPDIPETITRNNQERIFKKNRLFRLLLEGDSEQSAKMIHRLRTGTNDEKDKTRFTHYLKEAFIEPSSA